MGGGPAPGFAEVAGGERRRVTVLFCDLVGSTELAGRLDPEELREIVVAYQRWAAEVVERYGGYVAQYLGDGILAYFGYPLAHEDDPVRSVYSGLAIIEAVQDLNRQEKRRARPPLAVRVGIHSGTVVAGEVGGGGRREQLAMGQTPNVAARLQGLAEPNTLLVSGIVARLVEGFFECQPLGTRELKGLSEPIEVLRPIRATRVRTRFDVSRSRGLGPMVGRAAELGLLMQRFQAVRSARGRTVLVTAEAGIGKSRLVEELRVRTSGDPRRWLVAGGSPYHQDTPFHPLVDLVRQLLGVAPESPAGEQFAALRDLLGRLDDPPADALVLLAALLSLPPNPEQPSFQGTPQQLKERTQEVLAWVLLRMTEAEPITLVVEDLHWVDASTLEFLGLLMQRSAAARLLVVLTARPSFTPAWGKHSRLSRIALDPLDQHDAETMVQEVARGRRLGPAVVRQLVQRADGVPLFLEELTRTVLGAAQGGTPGDPERELPMEAIPATLEDSLRARLDQLRDVGELVQAGAAIGREFSLELVGAVVQLDESELRRRLDRLVEAELLDTRGIQPSVTYVFRHALIQEAAYGSLLTPAREALHRRIAEHIVGRFPELSAVHPEVTAHHFTQAGMPVEAVGYWEEAGRRSLKRFANVEAVAHLRRALDCLSGMGTDEPRRRRELALLTDLATALVATRGFAAPEVAEAYDRALALCEGLGGAPELFWVLWGLGSFYQIRGPVERLLAIARQMVEEARRSQDPQLDVEAQFALGAACWISGDYRAAESTLDAVYRRCLDQPGLLERPSALGSVTGVNLMMNLALVTTVRGEVEKGRLIAAAGLDLARRAENPSVLAGALVFEAWRAQVTDDVDTARRAAEQGQEVSTDLPFWGALAAAFHGWARARGGQGREGLSTLQVAIAGLQGAGVRTITTSLRALEADVLHGEGLREEGLAAVNAALADSQVTGAHAWDADLFRLRGKLELLGNPPDHAAAEAALAAAVRIGREQGAVLAESRAGSAIARILERSRVPDGAAG